MVVPRQPSGREPAVNVPAVLLALVGVMAGVHALRGLLDDETEVRALLRLAFFPAPWSVASGLTSGEDVITAAEAVGTGEAGSTRAALARIVLEQGLQPWSCVTYAFLHGSWTHLVLNAVWLLAFGTAVVRRAGIERSLMLAVATAIGGAAAQWLSDPSGVQPMIGASAIVSGFMGAAATFIFRAPSEVRATRWSFLFSRRPLGFLLIWLVVNLIFGAAAVPLGISEGSIAWQAHIGGLVAGVALFPWIDTAGRDPSFRL